MAVFTRRQFSGEKGICHMPKTTITPLPDPSGFSPDPLTDILRSGARRLIEQAVEAELAALLAAHADDKTEDGRSRLVRHGYLPEREVMTGIGPVPVKVPRVRDRGAGAEKVRFTSSILPPYLRKAKSIEDLLPWLYLKGISSGDFQEALAAQLRYEPCAEACGRCQRSQLSCSHSLAASFVHRRLLGEGAAPAACCVGG